MSTLRLAQVREVPRGEVRRVLFETRSEKVYTLNPTAAAVVREIGAAAPTSTRSSGASQGSSNGTDGAIERDVAALIADLRQQGPRRGRPAWLRRQRRPFRRDARRAARRRGPVRAALRRLADHQRVQPRLPALHRGERARQGVQGRARSTSRSFAVIDQLIALDVPYLSFSGGEPMVHPHFFDDGRVRLRRAAAQLKIETNGHYLTPGELRAPARPRRQGGAGEPRRRARARPSTGCACWASSTARSTACATCAPPACRSRSTSRRRTSTSTRSARRSTSRTSSARTASTPGKHDVHRQRGQGVATSWRRPTSSTKRSSTRCARRRAEYRGRMRVYFHEMGLLEELRYRLAAPGCAAHRPAQRPGQAHQRAAVRLRRPAAPVADRRLGELPARLARTRASRSSSTTSPRDPRKTSDAAPVGPPLTGHRRGARRHGAAPLLRVGGDGALPLLPVRGTAALPAGRRLGLRDASAAFDAAAFWSGLGGVVLSVDRRRGVQRVFRRARWAPTACSIRPTCRRSRRRCSGSASSPSPRRSPSACS